MLQQLKYYYKIQIFIFQFYKHSFDNKTKENSEKSTVNKSESQQLNNQIRKPDFKNRTSYLSKYRKATTFTPSTTTTTTLPTSNNERSRYKFNRKFKTSSTESSKLSPNKVDTVVQKKALTRTSYYSRLRSSRLNNTSTEKTEININSNGIDSSVTTKSPLMSTTTADNGNVVSTVEQKNQINGIKSTVSSIKEPIVTEPINYYQERNLNKNDIASLDENNNVSAVENNNEVVVIPLLETAPVDDNNKFSNKNEEMENVDQYQMIYTTPKYHSSFRGNNKPKSIVVDNVLTTTEPPIRNLHTRKNAGRIKNEMEVDINNVHTKVRENNMRKYSDTFPKSTTAMMNGVSFH